MKMPKYADILKLSKEKIDESLAPIRANKAKKQAELEIAKLDEEIASKESSILEKCSAKDIDFSKIISLQDELALLERKRTQFKSIIADMFGDN